MRKSLTLFKKVALELNHTIQNEMAKTHQLRQLFWECTLRCNLHCRHCGSDCRTIAEQKDMPLDDFVRVLDEIIKKQLCDPSKTLIITTGGEPLLRQDLEDCARAIKERGFQWGMVSNGMLLTEDKLNSLVEIGLGTLAVSLDGFETEHNWMRGHEQSFHRVEQAIEAMKKSPDLVWDIITCVNTKNIDYLPRFRDYLIQKGVRKWRLFTIFPFGRAALDNELQLSDKQFIAMLDFIRETRLENKIAVSYGCDGFLGPFEGEVRDGYFSCRAGITVGSILADGSISGCLSIRNDYHQGNIYQDSFTEVWRNQFKEYRNRKWMKTGECSHCKMWRFCQGNGMHLRDGKGQLSICHYHKIINGLK